MQIALINLMAKKLLLIVHLLLFSSLLFLNKLKVSIITIRRTKNYKKSSTASLARGKIKIKAYMLLIRKL